KRRAICVRGRNIVDKDEVSQSQRHTLLKKAISTGFFGGIIWPVIWLMAYGLNMIKVNPVSLWDHFFWENLPFNRWYMYFVAILLYCVLSIVFAVIYYALFKKFYHRSDDCRVGNECYYECVTME